MVVLLFARTLFLYLLSRRGSEVVHGRRSDRVGCETLHRRRQVEAAKSRPGIGLQHDPRLRRAPHRNCRCRIAATTPPRRLGTCRVIEPSNCIGPRRSFADRVTSVFPCRTSRLLYAPVPPHPLSQAVIFNIGYSTFTIQAKALCCHATILLS